MHARLFMVLAQHFDCIFAFQKQYLHWLLLCSLLCHTQWAVWWVVNYAFILSSLFIRELKLQNESIFLIFSFLRCISQSCTHSETEHWYWVLTVSTAEEVCIWTCAGLILLVWCSLQLLVGCHTGHKWAEPLFATGQTGSSTSQPKEGPFARVTAACYRPCF